MTDEREVSLPELVRRLEKAESNIEGLQRATWTNAAGIRSVRETVEHLRKECKRCVTTSDFQPVQRVVYGIVGLILIAVMTALVGLVLKGGKP